MKKTAIGFFIVILSLFISLRFGVSKANSAYGELIFSEDFDSGFDNSWETRHFSGTNTNSYWKILNNKYGMMINESGQTGNSISGENWTDYVYELDMYPISGVDRNFVFRYQKDLLNSTKDKFYEVHVSGDNVRLGKAYGQGITISAKFQLDNYKEYRWRIELIGPNIKVFAKEKNAENFIKLIDYTDNENPYLSGSVGVRVGAGSVIPSEVYFDNINVFDLFSPPPTPTMTPVPTPTLTPTPPPPTPTPTLAVPYYSQRDDTWKNDQYDFLDRTIEQVGCALTSATMVLRHHGIDKLPLNGNLVDLNPGTLNQWLNLPENADGWWRRGAMSWGAVTRLAKILHDNYSPAYSKLEYQVAATDSAVLTDPLIFKYPEPQSPSGYHFVVGYGVEPTASGFKYLIHDPWDVSHTLLESPPTTLARAGHFYKTSSDLSFIFINADSPLTMTLKDSALQPVGLIQSELPLANKLDPSDQTGQPFWNLSFKYPPPGHYLLSLSATHNGWYFFEIYAYNPEGEVSVIKEKVYLLAGQTNQFQLNYQRGGNPVATLQPYASFASLRKLIVTVTDLGWLDSKTNRQYLRHLDVSESVYAKNPLDGLEVLGTLKTHFDNGYRQEKLIEPGYSLLIQEINWLLSVLD